MPTVNKMIELVTLMINNKLQVQNRLKIAIWNANVLRTQNSEIENFVHDKENHVILTAFVFFIFFASLYYFLYYLFIYVIPRFSFLLKYV